MDAHELDENGKIINTIVVRDLNFAGKRLVDASIGGTRGDSVINGILVPFVPEPTPQPIPKSVTRRQGRFALLRAGHFAAVESAIEAMDEPDRSEAKIYWNDSEAYNRDHPFVARMAVLLGLDDDALDQLFIAAAAIV